MEPKLRTFQELLDELNQLSPEQLQNPLTVYDDQEYFQMHFAVDFNDNKPHIVAKYV